MLRKIQASVPQTTYPNQRMLGCTTFSINAAFNCVANPIGTLNSEPGLDSMMLAFNNVFDAAASSTECWRKKHRPPEVKSSRQPKSGGNFHQSCVKKRYPSPMLAIAIAITVMLRSRRDEE
jgi:hypothetical protein